MQSDRQPTYKIQIIQTDNTKKLSLQSQLQSSYCLIDSEHTKTYPSVVSSCIVICDVNYNDIMYPETSIRVLVRTVPCCYVYIDVIKKFVSYFTTFKSVICFNDIIITRKPCCPKETVRCHSRSFRFKVRRQHSQV